MQHFPRFSVLLFNKLRNVRNSKKCLPYCPRHYVIASTYRFLEKVRNPLICWSTLWNYIFSILQHPEVPRSRDIKGNLPVKSDSHLPKKDFICFNGSPSKMMKNTFYFILKALFVLKIFKFLSWLFGHVEKTAWWER